MGQGGQSAGRRQCDVWCIHIAMWALSTHNNQALHSRRRQVFQLLTT